MTPATRRLCALAALFAPERAAALLGRLGEGAPEAKREAGRLVAAARRERLLALGEVLDLGLEAPAVAAEERPRVAEVLKAVRAGAPAGAVSAVLVRLCREQPGRTEAADHAATCRRP
jgi:hypothetical protein